MHIIITEELIELAAQRGACVAGLKEARSHIGEDAGDVLRPAYLKWAASHVPLPDAIAEELERRGYGRCWWKDGRRHRDDGPAVQWTDGTREWWRNGKRHRDDGPAVEDPSVGLEWYRDGKIHRDDGPALEWIDGTREWWRDGKVHRDDGPAVERFDGAVEWWRDGQRIAPPNAEARGGIA